MTRECLKLTVMPINDSSEIENAILSHQQMEDTLIHDLIPAINSVYMIAQMIEQETLGKIDFGPYLPYISALKECAQTQDLFSRDLAAYLAASK